MRLPAIENCDVYQTFSIYLGKSNQFSFWIRFKGRTEGEKKRVFLESIIESKMLPTGFLLNFFFSNLFNYLYIYFWLCWVFIAVHSLSLAAVSGVYSLVAGFSLWCLLIIVAPLIAEHGVWSMCASVVVVPGLTCPASWGIFLDQGLNQCPLHCKADS